MKEETFELRSDVIDLLQLLKATGYAATGGEAKMMVEAELIAVNGEVEGRKRRKLWAGDVVEIDGQVRIRQTNRVEEYDEADLHDMGQSKSSREQFKPNVGEELYSQVHAAGAVTSQAYYYEWTSERSSTHLPSHKEDARLPSHKVEDQQRDGDPECWNNEVSKRRERTDAALWNTRSWKDSPPDLSAMD